MALSFCFHLCFLLPIFATALSWGEAARISVSVDYDDMIPYSNVKTVRSSSLSSLSADASNSSIPPYVDPALADKNETFTFATSSLTNFHQIDDGVYRGAAPTSAGLEQLASAGFHYVMALDGLDSQTPVIGPIVKVIEGESPQEVTEEESNVKALGMQFFRSSINSMESISPNEDEIIRMSLAELVNPLNHPIYVHCTHGVDRTGLVAALYRVLFQGWTPTQALNEWKALGHEGFLDYVFTGRLNTYFKKMAPLFAQRYAQNPQGIRQEIINAGTA